MGRRAVPILRSDAAEPRPDHYNQTTKTRWRDLPSNVQQAILHGTGEEPVAFTYKDGVRSYTVTKPLKVC